MPIYEYKCEACSHMFETLQKVSESPLVDCPACGKPTLRKMISSPAFRLKGGGWYETDFKTGNKKNVSHPDKKAKKADKAVTSGGTDKAKKPAGSS